MTTKSHGPFTLRIISEVVVLFAIYSASWKLLRICWQLEIPLKVKEYFNCLHDDPKSGVHRKSIKKVSEKFCKNKKAPALDSVLNKAIKKETPTQVCSCKSFRTPFLRDFSGRLLLIIHDKFGYTTQKLKSSAKDLFSKCDQISSFLRICSHLLKRFFIENFFRAVLYTCNSLLTRNANIWWRFPMINTTIIFSLNPTVHCFIHFSKISPGSLGNFKNFEK